MSTAWSNEGNLGNDPEFKTVNVAGESRTLLQCSVYFDNPIPKGDGFEDKGGFWAQVEWWHPEAEHFASLFRQGMRVNVKGSLAMDPWQDSDGDDRLTVRVRADRMAVLPYRVKSIEMNPARSRNRDAASA